MTELSERNVTIEEFESTTASFIENLDKDIAGAVGALENAEERLQSAIDHRDRCAKNLESFQRTRATLGPDI